MGRRGARWTVATAVTGFVMAWLWIAIGGAVPLSQDATPESGAGPDQLAVLLDEGQSVYGTNCFECHTEGGAGPALAGDTKLANEDTVVKQIIKGSANGNMPAFASTLTDRQIAAVATYIRNSWDASYGLVLEADVTRIRADLKTAK